MEKGNETKKSEPRMIGLDELLENVERGWVVSEPVIITAISERLDYFSYEEANSARGLIKRTIFEEIIGPNSQVLKNLEKHAGLAVKNFIGVYVEHGLDYYVSSGLYFGEGHHEVAGEVRCVFETEGGER